MCLLRTPLGLVGEAECARAVAPGSSARERRAVARAYVDATRASSREAYDESGEAHDEARTDAVVSWLLVVEGVTRVRCALALSRGALTIEAVPYYIARIRNSRLRIHGPDARATVPLIHEREKPEMASSALAMFAAGVIPVPTREALCASFCFVYRSPHVHELHPRPTCAMCGGHGAGHGAGLLCSHPATRDSVPDPLPTINVCGAPRCCHRRAFSVLGLFAFTLDAPTARLEPRAPTEGRELGPLAPTEGRGRSPRAPTEGRERAPTEGMKLAPLGPMAPRDTIWMAHMRIALEFARIMFRAAGHAEGADVGRCAATAAMRDMKLCRMVVESIASASPVSALPLSATSATDHGQIGQTEQTENRSILALVWYK
jgi:hypothetical protein